MTEEEWAEVAAAEAVAAFEFAALPTPRVILPAREPEQLSFDGLLKAA